jgi:hypothetical protein
VQKDAGGRIGREIPRVNLIEDAEVRWIWRAIDIAFDDLRERGARGFEAQLHLIEHNLGLPFERSRLDITAFGIEGRQAGQVDEAVGYDPG